MRVIFAGGGTGGHVFMALRLAEALRRLKPDATILFVGTRQGLERRLVPQSGFELWTIRIGGLNRVAPGRLARSLCQLPFSLYQSLRKLRTFRPSVVVGVGGYSSGPVLAAARLLGYPAILVEPNSFPGFTNRILARWVQAAAVAFEETADWFGPRARLTGVPVRSEFFAIRRETVGKPLRVLVVGGSQGSRPINCLICGALAHLPAQRVRLVHQTGSRDYESVRHHYRQGGYQGEIVEFIDNMAERFACSDLIVSRAGALSVAEIAAAGKASLLIPFPQAADDHQRKNALALGARGAAVVLNQEETNSISLAETILALAADSSRLMQMARASRSLGKPEAADKIIQLMEEVAW